jgi:hypothetical protein
VPGSGEMNEQDWFSTKLRFAVMMEPDGASLLYDCVHLLRAGDFAAAFEKAVRIGEASQQEYLNWDGRRVQWRLMEVLSLDIIPSDDLDGRVVHAEPIQLDDNRMLPFGATFSPRASKPTQTI